MTTPDPFPRKPIEPLAPPSGSFDVVLGRARARRHHRVTTVTGVTAVFLAGLLGGLSMGGGVSGVQQSLIQIAQSAEGKTAGPVTTQTVTASGRIPSGAPRKHHTRPRTAPATVPLAVPQTPASTSPPAASPRVVAQAVRGRVVAGTGRPVSGLYVYTGTVIAGQFVPSTAPAAVTDANGAYSVGCTGIPLLITSWRLNTTLGTRPGGQWAATFVDKPVCSAGGRPAVTVVAPGTTLTGTVSTDLGCSDVGFSLSVQLFGDSAATVRLGKVHGGDTYSIGGLPSTVSPVESHLVVAQGSTSPVTLLPGAGTVTKDVTFTCPAGTPTAGPTTPTPSPTATVTPAPSQTSTSTAPAGTPPASPAGAPAPL